jgi:hypothetical protein
MTDAQKSDDPPRIVIDQLDNELAELAGRVPLIGYLMRVIPGSDRPDYCLVVLEDPIPFLPPENFDWSITQPEFRATRADGVGFLWINAFVICSRIVGEQITPTMRNVQINLAYVVDNTLGRDATLDFGKVYFANIANLNLAPLPDTEPASAE